MNAWRIVAPALQVHAEHIGGGGALGVLSVAHLIVRLMQEAPRDQRAIQTRTASLAFEPRKRLPRRPVGICRRDDFRVFDRLRDEHCVARGGEERLHQVNPKEAVLGGAEIEAGTEHRGDGRDDRRGLHQPCWAFDLEPLDFVLALGRGEHVRSGSTGVGHAVHAVFALTWKPRKLQLV